MVVKYSQLLADLKKKNLKPVYVLAGEEPFYIDAITRYIEENLLTPDEKEFNQTIVYGQDVDVDMLLSECKSYPMLSNFRVVIVKEAKNLKNPDKLLPYVKNPVESTVLVLAHKNKDLDRRLQLTKELEKSEKVALLHSEKERESDVPRWVASYCKDHSIDITQKATEYLSEFLGNDLQKIVNEIGKLRLIVGEGKAIEHEHILDNIGLSKEFNVFELQKAIATRNLKRAVSIAVQMGNSKNTSILAILPTLYNFFTKGLLFKYYMGVEKLSADQTSMKLKLFSIQKNDIIALHQQYSVAQLKNCIREVGIADLYAKGINAPDMDEAELMRNMVLKFLN